MWRSGITGSVIRGSGKFAPVLLSVMAKKIHRHKILINGLVQGVGFRPFVYNLAASLGLSGFITNTPQGVHIEVEKLEQGGGRILWQESQNSNEIKRAVHFVDQF